jgi:carnitine O-acetyltransferase
LLEKNNAAHLNTIDSALFSISLDTDQPTSVSEAGELLNGGTRNTGRNRWFEKTVHLVVFQNGIAGLSGEHAPLDAPMVGSAADYIISKYEVI